MNSFMGGTPGAIRDWAVNRRQHSARAVGGTLSLMPDSLLFKPHVIDAALDGQRWQAHLSQIRYVGREEGSLSDLFAGGLADRLRIDLWDGSVELFNVWNLDHVIQTITQHVTWFQQHQAASAPAPAAARFCGGCGAPLLPANRFCTHCGRPAGQ